MKAVIRVFVLLLVIQAGTWLAPQKASAQVSVSFQVFYDNLSPYGYWVQNPDYGYVWVPNVAPGFSPYGTNGYWVFTDAGWTWVSTYPWGWAPFHYGRWFMDPVYGYMWVPGNEWGPGWVSWRRSEGYYGWAPIGPGISIEIAYSRGYHIPDNHWRFVRDRDFGRTNINNYYINQTNNTTIINNSIVINNVRSDNTSATRYNAGPDRMEVQKRTGNAIAPVSIRDSDRPGQNIKGNELQIYKPRVERNTNDRQQPAPARVANLRDVKPASERNPDAQPQRETRPVKAEPTQPQREGQPVRDQQSQPQRDVQPAKEQPTQPQRETQPAKQQPQREGRPVRQQQQQPPPREAQPARQQQQQPQREAQPQKQQQQRPAGRPNKKQSSQQQSAPSQKVREN